MKKRILAILLAFCMALTSLAAAAAEEDEPAPAGEAKPRERNSTAVATLAGDVNGDGKVSASDASLILRWYTWLIDGSQIRSMINADVNRDFDVDPSDAAMILRGVVGLITLPKFPSQDRTLVSELLVNSYFTDSFTEMIAWYIQNLPAGNRRNLLYAASKYIGTPYGRGEGQLDCSLFVETAYKDAKIPESVYPHSNSDGTLRWFKQNHPEKLHKVKQDGYYFDTSAWKPGTVLIYVNPEYTVLDSDGTVKSEKADHLALFVGTVNGIDVIMDAGSDGTRLRSLWSGGKWELTYYVDPLG